MLGYFSTSKALLTVRSRVSFYSLIWSFHFWQIWNLYPWGSVWLCVVPGALPKDWYNSQPLEVLERNIVLQPLGDYKTSFWRLGSYPQPWGCDFRPRCSPLVHIPSVWTFAKSAHYLWLSPHPQLFGSPGQESSSCRSSRTGRRWLVNVAHQ